MKIIADIHIHSPYSRAVSKKLNPACLDRWARIKGISLLGTGDCTHGKWLAELRDNLEESGEGLYRLKEKSRTAFDAGTALTEFLPNPASQEHACEPVNFVLSGEISTIYKKDGKTRKVHHIVVLPDFRATANFNTKLERLGNIHSDGRPILGLDSAELLSLLLETDERALLIPAHIWTPWFSVLGAKSGFDSIEECYGDLSSHILAVETGLSSNPPMNWALSKLDPYSIISNSDAHSQDKLGREATIFEMEMSFDSFREALHGPGILGTVEFFPQEGKYHYDGHRSCDVFYDPEQAAELDGICPVCGKALTRGVMGRVLELADRVVDETAPCPREGSANQKPYYSLIPLKEIIGELLETGVSSKKVESVYGTLIEKTGSEFKILLDMTLLEIEKLQCPGLSGELLAEAIGRMRRGEVSISPGYDGEYGVIKTFSPGEQKIKGNVLFEDQLVSEINKTANIQHRKLIRKPENQQAPSTNSSNKVSTFTFDENQLAAISSESRETLIIAGPGTGKTAVLAEKIARIIRSGCEPASILALSFTVKAAAELRERIFRITDEATPQTSTFHSLCASILREQYAAAGLPVDFKILDENERDEILSGLSEKNWSRRRIGDYIEGRKRFLLLPGENAADIERILPFGLSSFVQDKINEHEDNTVPESIYKKYRDFLRSHNLVDYDGLIAGTVRLLAKNAELLKYYRKKFQHIFVDEYQDINFAQYALIRLLVPSESDSPSIYVIGDPNQAIYGFRGSDKAYIDGFLEDYPQAVCFELRKSFRCAEPITKAASQLANAKLEGIGVDMSTDGSGKKSSASVSLFRREYPTDKAEATGIANTIASLIGGTSFFAKDKASVKRNNHWEDNCVNPGDCAILLRASAIAEPVIMALNVQGIPFEQTGAVVWWEEEPVKSIFNLLQNRQVDFSGSAEEEIHIAWESLNAKKETLPETVEQLIRLAGLFGSVQALLDGFSQADGIPDIKNNGVKIMTIHSSKGLEFDHVFVPGLEEGILPFTLYDDSVDVEEEKRLLYVAMTRARHGLWLSSTASRNYRGRILKAPPSRFLSELENLIPLIKEDRPFKKDMQMKLF